MTHVTAYTHVGLSHGHTNLYKDMAGGEVDGEEEKAGHVHVPGAEAVLPVSCVLWILCGAVLGRNISIDHDQQCSQLSMQAAPWAVPCYRSWWMLCMDTGGTMWTGVSLMRGILLGGSAGMGGRNMMCFDILISL